jgi:serine/threonine protein phosphatase PrpC
MVDAGLISPEQAKNHAEKNKIYSCLGGVYPPEIESGGKVPLLNGDTLLLCSDGFWGELAEHELTHFLSSFPVLFAIPQLMDRAEIRGGREGDNLSALAINWHEEEGQQEGDFISTLRLDAHTVNTHVTQMKTEGQLEEEVTEDDIERAIAEIQAAIRKYSR